MKCNVLRGPEVPYPVLICQLNIDELQQTIWLVVIEAANLQQMQIADPINLEADSRGGLLHTPKYPANMSLLIAYERDTAPLDDFSIGGDLFGLLQHLERGRRRLNGSNIAILGELFKAHGAPL
jgi:hypothetical protein